jgi:hypothetical protein
LDRTGKRGEGGFSLPEVFVALLILSFGVIFLAMGQMTASGGSLPRAVEKGNRRAFPSRL